MTDHESIVHIVFVKGDHAKLLQIAISGSSTSIVTEQTSDKDTSGGALWRSTGGSLCLS